MNSVKKKHTLAITEFVNKYTPRHEIDWEKYTPVSHIYIDILIYSICYKNGCHFAVTTCDFDIHFELKKFTIIPRDHTSFVLVSSPIRPV